MHQILRILSNICVDQVTKFDFKTKKFDSKKRAALARRLYKRKLKDQHIEEKQLNARHEVRGQWRRPIIGVYFMFRFKTERGIFDIISVKKDAYLVTVSKCLIYFPKRPL